MLVIALIADLFPTGLFPVSHLFNLVCASIGFMFVSDEHGTLYAPSRLPGTLLTLGLEGLLGFFGAGWLPIYSSRVAIMKVMQWLV